MDYNAYPRLRKCGVAPITAEGGLYAGSTRTDTDGEKGASIITKPNGSPIGSERAERSWPGDSPDPFSTDWPVGKMQLTTGHLASRRQARPGAVGPVDRFRGGVSFGKGSPGSSIQRVAPFLVPLQSRFELVWP